jgi:hypothetical protein
MKGMADIENLDVAFLFSSDYELHLGQNFMSERKVLIEPTAQLLAECAAIGVPMTLFADVASIWRYREVLPASRFPDDVEAQLKLAVTSGHDAQLHLHPHWLTSDFDGCHWHPDASRYKLADLGFERPTALGQPTAGALIRRGQSYLVDLLRPSRSDYECVAFRAGGYAIQPGEREIFRALIAAGFRIDSSVVPGLRYASNVNAIDFECTPDGINYFVNSEAGLTAASTRGLFEVPIPAYRESLGETLARRARRLPALAAKEFEIRIDRFGRARPRGRGIQNTSVARRLYDRFLARETFTLELSGPALDPRRLIEGTLRFLRLRVGAAERVYVSPSCHPKDVFPRTLEGVRQYWSGICAILPKARAITFSQAAQEVAAVTPLAHS